MHLRLLYSLKVEGSILFNNLLLSSLYNYLALWSYVCDFWNYIIFLHLLRLNFIFYPSDKHLDGEWWQNNSKEVSYRENVFGMHLFHLFAAICCFLKFRLLVVEVCLVYAINIWLCNWVYTTDGLFSFSTDPKKRN